VRQPRLPYFDSDGIQGRQVVLEILDTAGTDQFSKPTPTYPNNG
jgi:hypothetical protein